MAIRPIDVQVNLSKRVDVKRIQQQQEENPQADRPAIDTINERISEEETTVQKTETSKEITKDKEEIKVKEESQKKKKQQSKNSQKEKNQKDKKKPKEPYKGNIIDIVS